MTPDQIQQFMHQQMQTVVAATPLWAKALFLLQVLSLLVTVICLPLITWKLFFSGKPGREAAKSFVDDARLREIRTRREALTNLSGTAPPTSAPPNSDSRFRPPE